MTTEQLSLLDIPIAEDFHDRAIELRQQINSRSHGPPKISELIREWDEVHKPPANKGAIAFYIAQAAIYLKLMTRMMEGTLTSQEVRTYEIKRLNNLRQIALQKIKELET